MKALHYTDAGFRKRGRTACGRPLEFIPRERTMSSRPRTRFSYVGLDPKVTEDMDRVTCKACLRCWAAFVKRENGRA